jgi:hypothetical protein
MVLSMIGTSSFLTILATASFLLAGFAVYKVTKLSGHGGHGHSHGAEKERLLPKYGANESR